MFAKMLGVESEGACPLTLAPKAAHLFSQELPGKFTK
jgi:hypothetical protein